MTISGGIRLHGSLEFRRERRGRRIFCSREKSKASIWGYHHFCVLSMWRIDIHPKPKERPAELLPTAQKSSNASPQFVVEGRCRRPSRLTSDAAALESWDPSYSSGRRNRSGDADQGKGVGDPLRACPLPNHGFRVPPQERLSTHSSAEQSGHSHPTLQRTGNSSF